jgi:hypothetical protein
MKPPPTALQIEALNLLLDGELASSVRDHRALDAEATLRRLPAPPARRSTLGALVMYARRF